MIIGKKSTANSVKSEQFGFLQNRVYKRTMGDFARLTFALDALFVPQKWKSYRNNFFGGLPFLGAKLLNDFWRGFDFSYLKKVYHDAAGAGSIFAAMFSYNAICPLKKVRRVTSFNRRKICPNINAKAMPGPVD